MSIHQLSKEEIEELGYYDFTAYVGVPYFHWGGMEATDRLASLCGVGAGSRVLVVGCGSGFSACHLAKSRGCQVVGVDIARLMITQAEERAREWGLGDRARFLIADAHDLPLPAGSFDVVISEFVTVFLDKPKALGEYVRVTVPGGFVGMNELYKKDDIPDGPRATIENAETEFEQAVGLKLDLSAPSEWRRLIEVAGLVDVSIEDVATSYNLGEYSGSMGGMANMVKVVSRTLFYMSSSQKLRKKLVPVGRLKDVLMKNKDTRDYVGAILCVGKKPA